MIFMSARIFDSFGNKGIVSTKGFQRLMSFWPETGLWKSDYNIIFKSSERNV